MLSGKLGGRRELKAKESNLYRLIFPLFLLINVGGGGWRGAWDARSIGEHIAPLGEFEHQ